MISNAGLEAKKRRTALASVVGSDAVNGLGRLVGSTVRVVVGVSLSDQHRQ